ncbi:MAG: tetraacyldisaccharide 4'-kinase [Alphaproteobacteria bacterium]
MRAPEFWRRRGVTSALLWPVGQIAYAVARLRAQRIKPAKLGIPVICIGNVTAGGSGKTPTAIAVAQMLRDAGKRPHFLLRGYGGRERGPLRVEPGKHDHLAVGDEALVLARRGPTWISRDRAAGARAAEAAGADVIVMDDGFQNPSIAKDFSILVFDGGFGVGNNRLIPGGPLREPLAAGLARADAVLVIGDDTSGIVDAIGNRKILRARFVPGVETQQLIGRSVVAFAGIGRPEKFFETLVHLGAKLVEAVPFADHHDYSPDEIMFVLEMAAERNAVAVTTEKDFMRLNADMQAMVEVAPVRLEFEDPTALEAALLKLFK